MACLLTGFLACGAAAQAVLRLSRPRAEKRAQKSQKK